MASNRDNDLEYGYETLHYYLNYIEPTSASVSDSFQTRSSISYCKLFSRLSQLHIAFTSRVQRICTFSLSLHDTVAVLRKIMMR